MDKETLIEMYKETWNVVKKTMPNDLELPYLSVGAFQDCYNDANKSVNQTNLELVVEESKSPASISLINKGLVANFKLYNCGIFIPEDILNYSEDEIKTAVVHEQVHEVLKNSSLIYGIKPVLCGSPELNKYFDDFIETVTHAYSSEIFKNEFGTSDIYFKSLVEKYTLLDNEEEAFNFLENKEKQIDFAKKLNEFYMSHFEKGNPIKRFDYHLQVHLTLNQIPDEFQNLIKKVYNDISNSVYMVERRLFDGKWKVVLPIDKPVME